MTDYDTFRGGPLEDGRQSQVHSLVVHMAGDGRESIGAYIQVDDNDDETVFEWRPNPLLVQRR